MDRGRGHDRTGDRTVDRPIGPSRPLGLVPDAESDPEGLHACVPGPGEFRVEVPQGPVLPIDVLRPPGADTEALLVDGHDERRLRCRRAPCPFLDVDPLTWLLTQDRAVPAPQRLAAR